MEKSAFTIRTFVDKVISLQFNTLSRFVIAFFPRKKYFSLLLFFFFFQISWLQSLSTVILETRKIQSATVSTFFPYIGHEVMGLDVMVLIYWMLSFKPASLFSFTFIKRLFSFSSLSAVGVVSSAYMMLFLFLPAILILAYVSSSLVFTWCTLHIR